MAINSPALSVLLRACSVLALGAVLIGCTGRGGGYLPPDGLLFGEQATLGFSFSCERSAATVSSNAPTGRLRLQLSYTDHGSNPLGSGFSVHGEADSLDPVLESAVCIGQEPPPGGNVLIVLGRYWPVSSPPAGFRPECRVSNSQPNGPYCRFEAIITDNDQNRAPSRGDGFSIRLSTVTDPNNTVFPASSVFYARSGVLLGGNLEVD
jgi:hypothetical protein